MGLREKILAKQGAPGLKRERVEFCGCEVWAWELTGKQRAEVEQARYRTSKKGEVSLDMLNERAKVVMFGVKDSGEDGARRVFNLTDDTYLNQLPASELDVPYEVIIRLSGMLPNAKEDAKKNSEPTPSADSSTDSPTDEAGPALNGDLRVAEVAN